MNHRAIFCGSSSAALFGISTPAAKALLGSTNPEILAGLLYCGAGVGVAVLRRLGGSILPPPNAREVGLGRADMPWLAGAIVAGGIIAPVLLLVGLTRTAAAAASRSEEHTSELQSLTNLVCRLLLEKKKDSEAPDPLIA